MVRLVGHLNANSFFKKGISCRRLF